MISLKNCVPTCTVVASLHKSGFNLKLMVAFLAGGQPGWATALSQPTCGATATGTSRAGAGSAGQYHK